MSAQTVSSERWLGALLDPRCRIGLPQSGHVRLFEGWVVKPRAIPEHLVYLVDDSVLHGRLGSRRIRLDPGMLLWAMPGALHEFWLPEGPRPLLYQFKLVLEDAGGRPLRLASDYVEVADGRSLIAPLAEVMRESSSRDPFATLRLRAALVTLLSGALRLSRSGGVDGPVLDARQREKIAAHVSRRAAERVEPAQLARLVGLNADYFTRLFTRTYGMPPRRWILRERMRVAADLLREGDEPIAEVAKRLGYPDVFLFSRQFKQAHGRSPRAFRKSDR
jgi:AraC-like DNA-binding protein